MSSGPLWSTMNAQPRSRADDAIGCVPQKPGVYAWYENASPIYVGKGTDLRRRILTDHLGASCDLSRSAFQRNVCERLGIAETDITRQRPPQLSVSDVQPVKEFIRRCEVAWIVCDGPEDAVSLEDRMKEEWMPPLTKR